MKKYLWKLFLLFCAASISCDDDEVAPISNNPAKPPVTPNIPGTPDTTKPALELESPDDNSNLVVIESLRIRANIEDNSGLKEFRIFLLNPIDNKDLFNSNHDFSPIDNPRKISLGTRVRLALGTPDGLYKLIVEAEDMQGNVARDSVFINVSAPDIDEAEFTNIFTHNGFISNYMYHWDYTPLTESELSNGLFYVIGRKSEDRILQADWEKFISDFEIKNQKWTVWDVNSDGYLAEREFSDGFIETKLFVDWDQDKDGVLSDSEMAKGFFKRWDSNKNGKLNRKEYEEKVHAYLF